MSGTPTHYNDKHSLKLRTDLQVSSDTTVDIIRILEKMRNDKEAKMVEVKTNVFEMKITRR